MHSWDGYLMAGAVPRARGEEVTAGASLTHPRSRKVATAQHSYGFQCDRTPAFPKGWLQEEKKQQTREMQQA